MRGRPKKQITTVPLEENPTRFIRTYEDEYTIDIWTYDLTKSPYGPINVDIKYKTGAEKRMEREVKENKQQKKIAREMKKINKRNKNKN